jgi:hypothetical protein
LADVGRHLHLTNAEGPFMSASDSHRRPNRLEIDLESIVARARTLREQVGSRVKIVAALKAIAYGFVDPRGSERRRGCFVARVGPHAGAAKRQKPSY